MLINRKQKLLCSVNCNCLSNKELQDPGNSFNIFFRPGATNLQLQTYSYKPTAINICVSMIGFANLLFSFVHNNVPDIYARAFLNPSQVHVSKNSYILYNKP